MPIAAKAVAATIDITLVRRLTNADSRLKSMSPEAQLLSEPRADGMPTFAPENKPAASLAHDIKLLCNRHRFVSFRQAKSREQGVVHLGRLTCSFCGVGCRKQCFPI